MVDRISALTEHLSGTDEAVKALEEVANGGMPELLDCLELCARVEHGADGGLVGDGGPEAGDAEIFKVDAKFSRLYAVGLVDSDARGQFPKEMASVKVGLTAS